jgi:uncharacterized RDD family membrane protein YckC
VWTSLAPRRARASLALVTQRDPPSPSIHPAQLDVATPERVSLELPVAGIGYRSLAYLVDVALLFTFWVSLFFVISYAVSDATGLIRALSGFAQTMLVLGVFATQWLFWTVCEVAFHGQTPGKRLLRIRVVRDDGSPVDLFPSAVRNLLRLVDFLPVGYALGAVVMMATRPHRRIGDWAAGTLVVRDERVDLSRYLEPPSALTVAVAGEALLPADAELISAFLARQDTLEPASRARLVSAFLLRYGQGLASEQREAMVQHPADAENYLRARAGLGS